MYIVDAGGKNNVPNCCSRTLSSCRQSGAISLQCEQAARAYPVMTTRSGMCPISAHLRALALFCHRCLSRGGSGGPRLVMASLFVSSLCLHVISCSRCGCVFRCVWRAKAWTSAHCSCAGLPAATTDRRHAQRSAQKSKIKTTRERHSFWHVKKTSTCFARIKRDGSLEKAARKVHIVEFGATEMARECRDDGPSRLGGSNRVT